MCAHWECHSRLAVWNPLKTMYKNINTDYLKQKLFKLSIAFEVTRYLFYPCESSIFHYRCQRTVLVLTCESERKLTDFANFFKLFISASSDINDSVFFIHAPPLLLAQYAQCWPSNADGAMSLWEGSIRFSATTNVG